MKLHRALFLFPLLTSCVDSTTDSASKSGIEAASLPATKAQSDAEQHLAVIKRAANDTERQLQEGLAEAEAKGIDVSDLKAELAEIQRQGEPTATAETTSTRFGEVRVLGASLSKVTKWFEHMERPGAPLPYCVDKGAAAQPVRLVATIAGSSEEPPVVSISVVEPENEVLRDCVARILQRIRIRAPGAYEIGYSATLPAL